MRPKPLAAVALGVLAAALGGGQAAAAARTRATPKHAPKHAPTVSAVLTKELVAGQISAAAYDGYYAAYLAAKRTFATLTGTRHSELGAVIANLQAMAAAGSLEATLLPLAFLTLERNTQLWGTGAVPATGSHVSFPGSELVWEYYAGQGVELQWLATFGEGNGYWSSHQNSQLRQLLAEAIPLAAQRAGGIAWDYMFAFDGGAPPWTSGLSQGTGLQLLARAYQRYKEPAYLTAAQQALRLFEVAPPQGVRVATPVGALYAEYTFAPKDRILNGFIQALVGLYEYTAITREAIGEQLFEAGDAEARAIVPKYNTGAWSLYDQFGESDLNYHELLTEFLQHLCERTRRGEPMAPGAPVSEDAIYCSTAEMFTADEHTAPVVELVSKTLRGGTRAGVLVTLSKVATVELTIREGTRVVRRVAATPHYDGALKDAAEPTVIAVSGLGPVGQQWMEPSQPVLRQL